MPRLSRSGPKMLFDHVAGKAVVAGRHRRVGREDGLAGHRPQGFVEGLSVVLHPLANHLQRGKGAVPFVQMIHAGRDPQRPQRSHAADPQHQFLPDPDPLVAAIQTAGQFPILRPVPSDVAVQEIQLHAADVQQPDLGQQAVVASVDSHRHRFARRVQGRLHRQILDARLQVLLGLPAVRVQLLLEVPLTVEQPDSDQGHAQAAGALDVVARQHPEAARVDRDRLVDAEFGREVGHRQGAQDVGVRLGPGAATIAEVLLQPAKMVVDPAVQHHFGGPRRQPLRRELAQQSDRIVIQLPPTDRVQVSEQAVDFGMPSPPKVVGQGTALVVNRLGRLVADDFDFGDVEGGETRVGSAGVRSLIGLPRSGLSCQSYISYTRFVGFRSPKLSSGTVCAGPGFCTSDWPGNCRKMRAGEQFPRAALNVRPCPIARSNVSSAKPAWSGNADFSSSHA